jgi:hypothetical protein
MPDIIRIRIVKILLADECSFVPLDHDISFCRWHLIQGSEDFLLEFLLGLDVKRSFQIENVPWRSGLGVV